MGAPGPARGASPEAAGTAGAQARSDSQGICSCRSHGRHRPDAGRDRAWLPARDARVIFVDSNIPMYLIGRPHPNKEGAQRLLEEAAIAGERLVTDVEVLQEILHRYDAL